MPNLKETMSVLKERVDPVIEILLLEKVSLKLQKIVNYQIQTGGKRIRPILAILSCKMLKGNIKDVLYPAASLEILHNYTLIIDDIVDNGKLRRNEKTTWFKYGKSIANFVSMNYAVSVFEAISHAPNAMRVLDILSETLKTITEGQCLDVLLERSGRENEEYIKKNRPSNISTQKYLEMISKKTASLIQSSCEIGGLCANAQRKDLKALREFGFNLGIAFQIQDDILDIFGKEKEFGKEIGKDIEERKGGNIIILFALKELKQIDKDKVLNVMKKKKITKSDIKKVISLIEKTKSREKAEKFKRKYFEKAKKYLGVLPKNKYNNLLSDLANYVVQREK